LASGFRPSAFSQSHSSIRIPQSAIRNPHSSIRISSIRITKSAFPKLTVPSIDPGTYTVTSRCSDYLATGGTTGRTVQLVFRVNW
jgi:hypothetical protein